MNATTTCGAAVVLAVTAAAAGAQVTKTVPGEVRVVTATVEAIERASREVTVKKADGKYEVVYVPTAIKRFDTLKIGDKITLNGRKGPNLYSNSLVALDAADGRVRLLARAHSGSATPVRMDDFPRFPPVGYWPLGKFPEPGNAGFDLDQVTSGRRTARSQFTNMSRAVRPAAHRSWTGWMLSAAPNSNASRPSVRLRRVG
jgi:hypothetical protein